MPQHYVYSFYAELRDYRPKIWRRFEINGEKTIAELGYAIMLMFEMQASHLFCFRENSKENFLAYLRAVYPDEEKFNSYVEKISMDEFLKNFRYELPSEDMFVPDDERLIEADKIKLSNVTNSPGWKTSFEYDFGDGWEIDLTIEKCEKREISLTILPRVLEGEGFGIVEDVGGVGGLENLAKILKKGKGKEYKEFCDWLGSDSLDLEAFDVEDMNFRLKKLLRVYRDSYEDHYEPTERSLSLLLREYKGKGPRGY
ncbi:MAG: plasmid pRiA4b ORF-3 family protein [Synergistaceae bacterium]|nr:plasmid pRiA4b ORF-3 family protein [Synergistaceae bacterium]